MIPVLLLIVPIFDTTLVSISRTRRGLIPFASPGKDHTAHRLANRARAAWSGPGALRRGGCLRSPRLAGLRLSVELAWVLAFVVVLAVLAAVVVLERFPYERQDKPGKVP